MSIASIITRGFIDGVNFIPTRGYTPGTSAPVIVGGHFLPASHKRRRTLSNVQVIYAKAKELPRKDTKELRDAISEFLTPEIARVAQLPDIDKINYEALEANDSAYEKFTQALQNIEERLNLIEQNKIALLAKQQEEDDELLLITFISCIIH